MIGSIERGWRHLTRSPLVPVVMLVVAVHGPVDPTRRNAGYGGVLPVPAPAATPASATPRADSFLDQQRKDVRAARGRVLYAAGHEPQAAAPRAEHKDQCPERRVVQGRANSSPNS